MKKTRLFLLAAIVFLLSNTLNSCAQEDLYYLKRKAMIDRQIVARGVKNKETLNAMMKVKRHLFCPLQYRALAYEDHPLPIGYNQTISQPYIVAYMTEAAGLRPTDRVLERGTGSGYQAAVLAEIAKEVYTIEIVGPLADSAKTRLEDVGYKNIKVKWGDGYKGWPEYAPFDAIIVTAAPPLIPKKLIEQLEVGGRMVIPVGSFFSGALPNNKN